MKIGVASIILAAFSSQAFAMSTTPSSAVRPLADTSCQVSKQNRAERIEFLEGLIEKDGQEQTKYEALRTQDEKALEVMNWSYLGSTIADGISVAAGIVYSAYLIKKVLVLKQEFEFLGIPLNMAWFYTYQGGRAVTLSSEAYVIFQFKAEKEQTADLETVSIENMSKRGYITNGAINFLTKPDCGGTQCSLNDPDLDDAWNRLQTWHESQQAKLDAEPKYWYSSFWEWRDHQYGRHLSQVEIPWLYNSLRLFELRQAYYGMLHQILLQDQAACSGSEQLN